MSVTELNNRRSATQVGMVALRMALIRFETAVEAREGGAAGWEAIIADIGATPRLDPDQEKAP